MRIRTPKKSLVYLFKWGPWRVWEQLTQWFSTSGPGTTSGPWGGSRWSPDKFIVRNQIDLCVSVTQRVYKWNQMDPNGSIWFHLYTLRVKWTLIMMIQCRLGPPINQNGWVPGISFHMVVPGLICVNLRVFGAKKVENHWTRGVESSIDTMKKSYWESVLFPESILIDTFDTFDNTTKRPLHIPPPVHHINAHTAQKSVVPELDFSAIWGPTIRTPQEDHHTRLRVIDTYYYKWNFLCQICTWIIVLERLAPLIKY